MMKTGGEVGLTPPVVKTRLPKIAKSSRATGIWSRKISPAGLSYLKMDDEVKSLKQFWSFRQSFSLKTAEKSIYILSSLRQDI